MALLHLLRHGETDWNAERRWQGHADRPLTATGQRQAALLAPLVAALEPVAIHSSDLARAVATAAPAAALLGLSVVEHTALREIDTGSWTGRSVPEIRTDDPTAMERHEAGETSWAGGETFQHMHDRVIAALDAIAAGYAAKACVVIVAHGGPIRTAVAHAAGGSWRDARRGVAHVGYASLTVIDLPAWRLTSYNVPLVDASTAHDVA